MLVDGGWKRGDYHIHAGYPGIQHSGKLISWAPCEAASAIREQVLVMVALRSSQMGSLWVTATRMVGGGGVVGVVMVVVISSIVVWSGRRGIEPWCCITRLYKALGKAMSISELLLVWKQPYNISSGGDVPPRESWV